ncbi:MAG: trehalose-phosphatase [Elusimicrobiota bacterium]|nr:trehalose-phosphatase [Elusimicrobiota bacterium]
MSRPERRLVALDFDGTLAALRRAPASVRLPEPRRRLLARLARTPGTTVLVVSGRPRSFLRRVLAGAGAALSAEHGWLLEGVGPRWRHPLLRRRARQARVLAAAARRTARAWPGARVEAKTVAVAVHWRLAPSVVRDPRPMRRALRALVPAGWRLTGGKRVFEFRPSDRWGKGEAIRLAARRLRAAVVFIGDDETDEEAFRLLGRGARTVKVGFGRTEARERVAGIRGVDALLRGLARSA